MRVDELPIGPRWEFTQVLTSDILWSCLQVRRRILMICKQSYANQKEKGMISTSAAQILRSLADRSMTDDCQLNEWEQIERLLRSSGLLTANPPPEAMGERAWARLNLGAKMSMLGEASAQQAQEHGRRYSGGGGRRRSSAQMLTMKQFRALSLAEKAAYILDSATWTAVVLCLVGACTALMVYTLSLPDAVAPASCLSSLFTPAELFAPVRAAAVTALEPVQYVAIAVRTLTCLVFTCEMVVRCLLHSTFVKALADPVLLLLIAVAILDLTSLFTFGAVGGYAQWAVCLRALHVLHHASRRCLRCFDTLVLRRADNTPLLPGGGGNGGGSGSSSVAAALARGRSRTRRRTVRSCLQEASSRMRRRLQVAQYRLFFNVSPPPSQAEIICGKRRDHECMLLRYRRAHHIM